MTGRPTISTVNLELSFAMNGFWKKRTVAETPAGDAPATVATVEVAIWKTPKLMRYLGRGTCYEAFKAHFHLAVASSTLGSLGSTRPWKPA